MVATRETPDLVPEQPDWLQRQEDTKAVTTNRNINDIYWAKGPREADPGWIIVGPSAEMGSNGRPITTQAEAWIRKGRTPLIEYSFTNRVSPKTGQRETLDPSVNGGDRLSTPDRWYWLFRNGGAHLFPIEQIVAHHWHITPPYGLPKSVFPQLDEYDVPSPFYCPACAGSAPPKNSAEEVIQHLMISHRMTLPQARDLETQSHGFVDQPVGSSGLAIRRKAQRIEHAAETQAEAPLPVAQGTGKQICNACGEEIPGKLKDHVCTDSA